MNDDFPCCKHSREHARPLASEPTEAEVEAGARAIFALRHPTFEFSPYTDQWAMSYSRDALRAAAEARR